MNNQEAVNTIQISVSSYTRIYCKRSIKFVVTKVTGCTTFHGIKLMNACFKRPFLAQRQLYARHQSVEPFQDDGSHSFLHFQARTF